MIKLQDILNENLDIDKLFNNLLTKVKQSGQSTVGLENEFNKADNPVAKLKVLNKYKNIVKESVNESVYFDPKSNKELDLQWNGRQWEIDIRKKDDMSFSKPVTIKRDTLEQIKDWCRQYNLPTDWITEKEMNEVESAFKIDPALASKIYDILVKEGVKLDMTKSYFFNFLNDRL
jgi:hypothetical protein